MLTPISDLVARIVARVLDKRQAPEPTPPVPEDDPVDDRPRYGGVNGGPLVSDVTDPVERIIRETLDQFDDVYLRGPENWLARQRTGRLCENLIERLRWAQVVRLPFPEDPNLARQAEAWAEPENEAPLFANAPTPEKTPRSQAAESPEAEVR